MAVMKSQKKGGRIGRPPAGIRGERVSDYPQVMLRLPQKTKDVLDALSGVTGTPVWRLIDAAVDVYIRSLPESQRQLVSRVQTLRASNDQSKPE